MKYLYLIFCVLLFSSCSIFTRWDSKQKYGRAFVLKNNPELRDTTKRIMSKIIQSELKYSDTVDYTAVVKYINYGNPTIRYYKIHYNNKDWLIKDARDFEYQKMYEIATVNIFPKEKEEEIWSKTIDYVMNNSDSKIQLQTEYIIQTYAPSKVGQKGWSIVKIMSDHIITLKITCIIKTSKDEEEDGDVSNLERYEELRLLYYLHTGNKLYQNVFNEE